MFFLRLLGLFTLLATTAWAQSASVGLLWYPSYPGFSHVRVFIDDKAYNPNHGFEESSLANLEHAALLDLSNIKGHGFYKITFDASPKRVEKLKQVIQNRQRENKGNFFGCSYFSFQSLRRAGIIWEPIEQMRHPTFSIAYAVAIGKIKHRLGLAGVSRIEYFGGNQWQTHFSKTQGMELIYIPAQAVALIYTLGLAFSNLLEFSSCVLELVLGS